MSDTTTPDSLPPPHTPTALSTSLSSAKSLIALQLLSRLVTFSLNQALVRLASPTVFGTAAVQFELVRDTLLFLSREAVRGVVTRLPDVAGDAKGEEKEREENGTSKGQRPNRKQLQHLLFLPAMAGSLLIITALPFYIYSLPSIIQTQPSFYPSLGLYVLSTFIELAIVEPISLYGQYLSGNTSYGIKIRVKAEGTAVIARATGTVAWLAMGQYAISRRGAGGDGKALLGFAFGQVVYAGVLAWVHAKAYWSDEAAWDILGFTALSRTSETPTNSTAISDAYLDKSSRDLVVALSGQSLIKHLLTAGDMIVVARTSPLEDQGGYAVASNYASLVARIVFQPVEESSRLYFSKSFADSNTSPSAMVSPFLLLTSLIRISLFLLLLTPTFIPPLLPLLLPYLLPSKYLSTSAPSTLLAYLVVYLPIMSLNGILEAFFAATTTVGGLMSQSGAMIACSGAFAGTIWSFSSFRNDQARGEWPDLLRRITPNAESGLVYANAVQMVCRIVFAGQHALKLYGDKVVMGKGSKDVKRKKMRLLPKLGTVAMVAVSAVGVRVVVGNLAWEERLFMRGVVLITSGIMGLSCLGVFYFDERQDWADVSRGALNKDD